MPPPEPPPCPRLGTAVGDSARSIGHNSGAPRGRPAHGNCCTGEDRPGQRRPARRRGGGSYGRAYLPTTPDNTTRAGPVEEPAPAVVVTVGYLPARAADLL